jgi:hydroxymethylbilane synthase
MGRRVCVSETESGIKVIRIAARHSDLARLQAYRVGDALCKVDPNLRVEYAFRASLGDINQRDPLWKMPERGVFTEDFLADLVEGSADLVVHSWKDLPTEARPHTEIVATLPRADVRDLLLFRKDRLDAARRSGKIRVLTSSPRRAHNLKLFLEQHLPFNAEVSFENVRGNIPTRLTKLLNQDVDALVVAKAALDRLLEAPEVEFAEVQTVIRGALVKTRLMCLPLSINPTAAAQGALAVEINKGNLYLHERLKRVNCNITFDSVNAERRILASYGGGCHQKIGVNVLRRSYGEITFLRGLTDAGEVLDRVHLSSRKVADGRAGGKPTAAQIFPREGEDATFFERVPLERESWVAAETAPYLWIARENAWPNEFQPAANAVVWTAGLKTWRKLAKRGVWVTGSSEGLGESEPTRLETLLGEPQIDWLKLTHQNGHEEIEGARICATYRLQELPIESLPDLFQRKHFFWKSASAFVQAVKVFPGILEGSHACGPGHTHHLIKERLGSGHTPVVYLNVDDWRRAVLEST